jgi:hypothetical protein
MDWAFSVNGLGLNLSKFKEQKLSFGFRKKSAKSKQSNDKVKYESFEKKVSKWTGLFFSKWTGLRFVRFLRKKNIVRVSEKSAGKSSEKIR